MSYQRDKGGFPRAVDHKKIQSTIDYGDPERLVRKYMFWCPGCEMLHWYSVRKPYGGTDNPKYPIWDFNRDLESPTFKPSLLVTHSIKCHLYLTDGKLRFLKDCGHDLAGKTVPLPDLPDYMTDVAEEGEW